MRRYTHVLFDLDGTLIYSHPGIYNCFYYTLEKMGLPEPTKEQLSKCIGPSLAYAFKNFFGMSEEQSACAVEIYRVQYGKTGVFENDPIEHAEEVLAALAKEGYILAMATSKPKQYADMIAERFGFSKHFTVQAGCGMDGSLPTKASVIAEAVKQLGVHPSKCLMVGDRYHDSEGAKENGMDCALLEIGYAENEQELKNAGAEYIFKDLVELRDFLLEE